MKISRLSLVLLSLPCVSFAQMTETAPAAETSETTPAVEAKWSDIRDFNYAKRAEFMAGLSLLQKRLEQQVTALKKKRENLPATEDPGQFDLDLNALATARTRFLSAGTDISKATSENWDQLKDRVGSAWENVQEAYQKAAGISL